MVFPTDMVSIGQQAVGFFNHVGGEGLARSCPHTGAKAANDTGDNADSRSITIASSGASTLANLDGRNDRALSVSYYNSKNDERERGQNRAKFWHGLASCGVRSRTILLLKASDTQL
jgi:hypothetical protein